MQKGILLLLFIVAAATVQAQSLKDLLYGGKLKNDSNSVVRKTDDLASKIDTGQKKPVVAPPKDSVATTLDSAKKSTILRDSTVTLTATGDSVVTAIEPEVKAPAVPVKTNTKLWKEYTDSLVATLQPEIDNSKKIKKGPYHVLVTYEIDTAGQVSINTVGLTPANEMLQAQIRQYMDVTPPKLNPVLDSAQQPRKVKRSGSFTLTKE